MTTILAERRRNLAANGSAGNGSAGWGQFSGSGGASTFAARTDGSPVPTGAYVRQTWSVPPSTPNGGLGYGLGSFGDPNYLAVTPGQSLAVGMWVRPSRTQMMHVFPFFYDSTLTTVSNAATHGTLAAGGQWTWLSWIGVVPPRTVQLQVGAYSYPVAGSVPWLAGDTLDAAGVLVEVGVNEVGDYFDGDLAQVGPYSYGWVGQPYASPSVEYVITAQVVSAGVFRPSSAIAWGLGDFDAPELVFNGVDEAGVEWVCPTPEGWDTTSVDTPILDNPGDGGTFSPGRRKPRVLTLRGGFRCADVTAMDAAATRLRAALEHIREDTVLWHGPLPDGAAARQMAVRLTGDLQIVEAEANPRVRTFTAVLTAADPLKYAAGAAGLVTAATTMPQSSSNFGVTFPLGFPADFGGGDGATGRLLLVNPGSQPVYPQVTYACPTGTVQTPILRHLQLGAVQGVARLLAAGDVVTVDHSSRLLLVNGQSAFTQRVPGCVFFPLPAGESDLFFSASTFNPAVTATVSYRPAWS